MKPKTDTLNKVARLGGLGLMTVRHIMSITNPMPIRNTKHSHYTDILWINIFISLLIHNLIFFPLAGLLMKFAVSRLQLSVIILVAVFVFVVSCTINSNKSVHTALEQQLLDTI